MAITTQAPPVPAIGGTVRDLSALAFAMTFPTLMSWLYFMVLPGEDLAQNPLLRAAFFLGKAVQFGFPLVFVALFYRSELRLSRPQLGGMGVGLVFGLATALAIVGLYLLLKGSGLFAVTAQKANSWLAQQSLNQASGFLLMVGFVSIPHSLGEEYYWRWFVFGWLRRRMPWPWAALISGLAFMSHHVVVLAFYLPGHFWTAVVPFSLGVAAGGMIWAGIYQRWLSLYVVWASHCLVDLGIMAVGYDLLRPYWHQ